MKKLFAIILSLGLIIGPVPTAKAAVSSEVSGYMQQAVGLANGIIGSSVLTKCALGSLQISIMVYMGASITYMYGEIAAARKKARDMDNQAANMDTVQSNMAEGGDLQKQAMQSQLDSLRSNLEFIELRRNVTLASLYLFGIATLVAGFEAWRALPPPVGLGITDAGACSPNPAANTLMVGLLGAAYSSLASSGGQINAQGLATGVAMSAGGHLLKPKASEQLAAKAAKTTSDVTEVTEEALQVTEPASVPLLNNSITRAIFFLAMTGLVWAISDELDAAADKARENISQLETAMSHLPGADNNLVEGASTSGGIPNPMDTLTNKKYALKPLPKLPPPPKQCLSGSMKEVTISQAGCANPIKFTKPKFDLQTSHKYPTMAEGVNTSYDYFQAMAEGDTDRASIEAGKLGQMASRISAARDEVLKDMNKQLVAQGKKPVDFKAEAKKVLDSMNARGTFPGTSGFGNLAEAANPTVSDTEKKEVAAAQTAPITAPVVTMPEPEIDLGLGTEEAGAEDPYASDALAGLDDVPTEGPSPEGEILKDPESSLFKQVSNRYLLNYKRFFQKKEIQPPLAEPQKAH